MTNHFNQLECSVCGAALSLGSDPMVNELIECADCGTEFEVIDVDPITIEIAPQVQEDWGE